MFGTFRYTLALLVAFGHIYGIFQGELNWTGNYAILSFYVLSGYLMTLVLQERYGFAPTGLARYAANRALRIYPVYWAALTLSLAIIARFPAAVAQMGPRLRVPPDVESWVANIVIFGLHVPSPSRLVPPSWSLSVELIFYVLMGLLLSRSRLTVFPWLGASLAYLGYATWNAWAPYDTWMIPRGSSFAFAAGAALYFVRGFRPPVLVIAAAALVFVVNILLAKQIWGSPTGYGFHTSVAASVMLVWGLSRVRSRDVAPWAATLDRFLGDLSYPIFLCHFQLGAVVIHYFYGDQRPFSLGFFVYCLPLIHLVALVLHFGVERPIASIRDRVRPSEALVSS